jgi:hypothetical protein
MSKDTGMERDEPQAQSPTERVIAIKRAYESELLSKPNVVGVGVGYRQKGGERTDDVALVVMVREKLPPTRLAPDEMIPVSIEGVPVDVQEVGEIVAF